MEIVSQANADQVLLVSPSASTVALSDQDDYFFRVTQTNADNARITATYLYQEAGWRKIAGGFSTANRTFTEGWLMAFKERFEALGGQMPPVEIITEEISRADIARNLINEAPDGIVIAAHALEVADISQELRKMGADYPVATTGVAHTPNLIQHGGEAVEGVIMSLSFFADKVAGDFQTRYHERFEKTVSLPDVYGYEAATVVVEALQASDDWSPASLKQTILDIQKFNSPILPNGLLINKFGDVDRDVIFITVKDGQFVTIE
jgi:branched-chain amino acid transport system substrate-binding protein